VEGFGSDEDLIEENYTLVENKVSWDVPGQYQVEYFNYLDNLYETRDVIITNLDNLQQGQSFLSQKTMDIDYSVQGIMKIDSQKTLAFGGKNTGYYPYQTQNETVFPYLVLYVNGQVYWERTISDLYYGMIKDAVVTERGITIIGDYDTPNQGRNVFIHEYSFAGQLLLKKEIHGENDDFAHRLFYINQNFYFVASSQSIKFDYSGVLLANNNIIIGFLDGKNNYQISLIGIGNQGYNHLVDVVFVDGSFYLLISFVGDGYFCSNLPEQDYLGLIAVNWQLSVIDWLSLSNLSLGEMIQIHNAGPQIGITSAHFATNRMQIFYFSHDLLYLRNETIALCEGYYQVKKCQVVFQNQKIVTLTKVLGPNNMEWIIHLFDENHQLLNQDRFACWHNLEECQTLMFDHHHNIYIGTVVNQNKITMTQLTMITIREETLGTNMAITKKWHLLINGIDQRGVLKTNSIGANPYGLYTNTYLFANDEYQIIIPFTTTFLLQTNIRNMETYDEGTTLYFNGQGRLNGNEVSSGTVVALSGNYFLEIIGHQQEITTLIFTVEKLSEAETPLVIDNKPKNYTVKETILSSKQNPHFVQLIAKNDSSAGASMEVYAVLIGIMGGIILSIFVSSKKVFRKKHD